MPRRKKGMLALTGSGDDGSTGLLGGGRVAKDDIRLEAYGTIDEASSAIGLARALVGDPEVASILEDLQRGLYKLGAELATNPERAGAFASMTSEDVTGIEATVSRLEAAVSMPDGFILPGATPGSAALDLARTVVRRAERRCVALLSPEQPGNPEVRRYLNRASLLLFVLGRVEEERAGKIPKLARSRA